MSVIKTTLAKEINNGANYVYPKTSADMVEYMDNITVKNKIDELLELIDKLENNTIVSAPTYNLIPFYKRDTQLSMYDFYINEINIKQTSYTIESTEPAVNAENTTEIDQ